MNIQITGDRLSLSPSIKTLINDKLNDRLEKLLTGFSSDIKTAQVRLQKDKFDKFIVNFDLNLPDKGHIYAQASHLSLESAIIDLEQEVEKQIKRYRQEHAGYSLG